MLICYSLYCKYIVENGSSISFPSEQEIDDKVSQIELGLIDFGLDRELGLTVSYSSYWQLLGTNCPTTAWLVYKEDPNPMQKKKFFFQQIIIPICYFLQFKVLISKYVREYNTVRFARPGSRCAAINRYVSLYLGDCRRVRKHHSGALRYFIHHIQYEFDTVFYLFFIFLCITFVMHLVSTIKFPLPKLNIFVCLNLTVKTVKDRKN